MVRYGAMCFARRSTQLRCSVVRLLSAAKIATRENEQMFYETPTE